MWIATWDYNIEMMNIEESDSIDDKPVISVVNLMHHVHHIGCLHVLLCMAVHCCW